MGNNKNYFLKSFFFNDGYDQGRAGKEKTIHSYWQGDPNKKQYCRPNSHHNLLYDSRVLMTYLLCAICSM